MHTYTEKDHMLRSMRGYLAYVYGKGAHFEGGHVWDRVWIWTPKRTPRRGQGRLEAKSCRFDEELQSQNTPPENILFYRFSGGPEGPPLGSPCCHFCSIFIGNTVTSGAVLSLLRLFYSQKRLFEAFLSLRPPFYSQRCPVGGRF